ncbi:MAG: hypothetical protein OEW56_09070 [Gemmatimonadota bacterium]|nr:hypothetical protein [Gemmatimonadota bacterium]
MRSTVFVPALLVLSFVLASCSGDEANKSADALLAPASTNPETIAVLDGNTNPGIIPPGANPHGKSYGKWSELWWQWMASAPALPNENPMLDNSGELIDYAQSGSVWFIAPSLEPGIVREATIPTGKSLFFCLTAFEASTYEGLGETEGDLRAAAAMFADLLEVHSFEVDGTAMNIGAEYRTQSDDLFCLTVPDENVFDFWGFPAEAGTYCYSVADGYYVMLAPLSAGDHVLHVSWSLLDLSADVTINLHVVGGLNGKKLRVNS